MFNVPPPNPYFTGRTEILTLIHTQLMTHEKSGCTASFALHGLGGVGKMQISIRYAYLYKTDFDIICWLQDNDWNTLVTSYVELSQDSKLTSVSIPAFEDSLDNAVIADQIKQ